MEIWIGWWFRLDHYVHDYELPCLPQQQAKRQETEKERNLIDHDRLAQTLPISISNQYNRNVYCCIHLRLCLNASREIEKNRDREEGRDTGNIEKSRENSSSAVYSKRKKRAQKTLLENRNEEFAKIVVTDRATNRYEWALPWRCIQRICCFGNSFLYRRNKRYVGSGIAWLMCIFASTPVRTLGRFMFRVVYGGVEGRFFLLIPALPASHSISSIGCAQV